MSLSLEPINPYPGLESEAGYLGAAGGRLYVERHHGPDADPVATPLLVIHGVGGSTESMDVEIRGAASERYVCAYDVRGHGRSVRPDRFDMDDHCADALAVADGLGLSRFSLLGYSMGSYIAQAVAVAAPQRVDHLVLAVTKGHGLESSTARLMRQQPERFAGKSAEELSAELLDLSLSPVTPPPARERIAARMAALARPELLLSPEAFAAANASLAGFDFRGRLAGCASPTLVISGTDDLLNPPDEGRSVAEGIPGARFVELAGAGHLLSAERPEEYVELVRVFLAGS